MINLFTSASAYEYSNQGKLEEWIHSFLCGEGNNIALSQGLMLEERYYIGPVKMSLDFFQRCCGPEKDLKYQIDKHGFEKRVDAIQIRLQKGWDMPPLIINYADCKFELNDGNHRYEALIRSGIKEYNIIVWITKQKDYKQFMKKYGSYLNTTKTSK